MIVFDEFGQFLSQVPPGLIANICTAGIGLLGLIAYFGVIKPRRARRQLAAREAALREQELRMTYGYVPSPAAEMPDVDLLTTAEVPAAPTPQPAQKVALPARRQGEYGVRLADGRVARAVEVITVLRDSADDRLIVQLGETAYRTLLDQPEAKARFSAVMSELARTIAQPDATPSPDLADAVEIVPPEVAVAAATEHLPESRLEDDATESEPLDLPDLDDLSSLPQPTPAPAPARPAPARAASPLPGDLPKPGAAQIRSGGFLRPARIEVEPAAEINIAGAIETYLQHKLWEERAFPGRAIHVHSAAGGGVMIQVDDLYYDAVGDVDDAEVRTYLAAAIQEWQDRQ